MQTDLGSTKIVIPLAIKCTSILVAEFQRLSQTNEKFHVKKNHNVETIV